MWSNIFHSHVQVLVTELSDWDSEYYILTAGNVCDKRNLQFSAALSLIIICYLPFRTLKSRLELFLVQNKLQRAKENLKPSWKELVSKRFIGSFLLFWFLPFFGVLLRCYLSIVSEFRNSLYSVAPFRNWISLERMVNWLFQKILF